MKFLSVCITSATASVFIELKSYVRHYFFYVQVPGFNFLVCAILNRVFPFFLLINLKSNVNEEIIKIDTRL